MRSSCGSRTASSTWFLHWRGDDHTALKVKKNTSGKHRWTVAEETEPLVCELARLMPDRAIASILNRAGKRTADWSKQWLDAKPGHKLAAIGAGLPSIAKANAASAAK